jgi:PHD/YefM family antitoxin component YafN of YafNO toxin-antitoxin module
LAAFEPTIHKNTESSSKLKLKYLLPYVRGTAKNKIKHLLIEGRNYYNAVLLQKKAYDDEVEKTINLLRQG